MGTACCTGREKIPAKGIVTTSPQTKAKVNAIESETKKLEAFVAAVIAEGKPWTDPEFPPELKSLIDPKIDKQADLRTYKKYSWKRMTEIYKG